MKTSRRKKLQVNLRSLIISIFSTIFIIGGSFFIYYFSKGYRIDVSEKVITKTGVLTVQSEPSSATLYINGDNVGRTPRSRTLNTGIQSVSVWKEGYREWKKQVEILEEKSTPIYPLLLLKDIKKSTLWESESTIQKYWTNKYKDIFVFLVEDTDSTHTLWSYRVNTPLWNLTPNPTEVLNLEQNSIELDISPNGQLALLKIISDTTDMYLVELQKSNSIDNLEPMEFGSEYSVTWAKDNRYLILESEEEILSFDTTKETTSLLIQKVEQKTYLWNTDEEGFFYTIEPQHTPEDEIYTYGLKQTKLDGTNSRYMIEKVYFQKDPKYIEHYRNNGDTYPEFKNSPTSTQTTGQIIYFEVNQSAKGVYIKTESSTYWYDITKNRYRMISPYSTELIQFSPDSQKLLFSNGNFIYVFTFDKEEADHTEDIGSKKVDELLKDNVKNIGWISNSIYLHYIKNDTLFICEKDGENEQDILNINDILLYSIKNSREHIITLEQGENLSIIQYKIK